MVIGRVEENQRIWRGLRCRAAKEAGTLQRVYHYRGIATPRVAIFQMDLIFSLTPRTEAAGNATARQRSIIVCMESCGVIHIIIIVSIVGVIRIKFSIFIGIVNSLPRQLLIFLLCSNKASLKVSSFLFLSCKLLLLSELLLRWLGDGLAAEGL